MNNFFTQGLSDSFTYSDVRDSNIIEETEPSTSEYFFTPNSLINIDLPDLNVISEHPNIANNFFTQGGAIFQNDEFEDEGLEKLESSDHFFTQNILLDSNKVDSNIFDTAEFFETENFFGKSKYEYNFLREYTKGKSFKFSNWNPYDTYNNDEFIQDFVKYNGTLWACVSKTPVTNTPPYKSNDKDAPWELVLEGSSIPSDIPIDLSNYYNKTEIDQFRHNIDARFDKKYGASYFEISTNRMLFFNSIEDLAEWELTKDSSLILDSIYITSTSDGEGGPVDTEMSDTSVNAVQNKVIKKYVDQIKNDADEKVDALEKQIAAKQDEIEDLEDIRSNAQKGASALQESDVAKVATTGSYNDLKDKPTIPAPYDDTELRNAVAQKQDTITDIDAIRSGASKGATALQSVPSEYVTETELTNKGYATTAALNNKVDKVEGKQLSTEDFTSTLKKKLEGLNNYDDTELSNALSTLRSDFDKLVSGDTTEAIKTFNEVIAFLDGVQDTQDLSSIIAGIQLQIANVRNAIPTMTSQLTNDSGFLTEHQDISKLATKEDVEKKQDKLESGVNIKTINGQSILGKGDIIIQGGGVSETLYSMKVTGLDASYNYNTTATKMEIEVGYESKIKEAGETEYVPFNESAIFSVEIYKADEFKIITSGNIVLSGNKFKFDLKPYLSNGANAIVVKAVGILSNSSGLASTTITVTTMSLSPFNFDWATAFVEGQPYQLGGLRIISSLNKELHIKVSGNEYSKEYIIPLGISQNDTIPYNFYDLEHPSATGIYRVEMQVKAVDSNIASDVLIYDIMCVAKEDSGIAQLVCVNEVATEVDNYTESKLFAYAIYNGGASSGAPTITLKNGDTIIASNTLTVAYGTTHDYSYAFALTMTEEQANISAVVEYGNTQTALFILRNETSFAPVSGYSFYMDAATRSNGEEDKTYFINAVDGSKISATWSDMAWVDGMDGWTTDDDGNRCLRLPAMSKATVQMTPMKDKATMTLVMYYKVQNAADFNEDVITIASDTVSSWMGVKIKPTNVLLHSQALFKDDLMQGYNTKDEEMVHLVITIVRNYDSIGNIAMIYVNGDKKCSFEWSTGDTFAHNGILEIGSNTADFYLYKMFVYDKQFSWQDAVQSWLSCTNSAAEKSQAKRKEDSVLNDSGELDYDKIAGHFNTFVVELPKGEKLPNRITNPSNNAIKGTNLYIDIVQDPNCTIQGSWLDIPLEGQGTTAMTYYRWNLRTKTSDAYGKFRITAKKNVASSMHSHKRGATSLFNDLYQRIVGANEVEGRMAVYQYPVYGFQKIEHEDIPGTYYYEFIGLYTIGPDKGDKSTFGFDNKTFKKTLIHMEGTDHSPAGVGYDYPWEQLTVGINKDGDAFIGAKDAEGGLAQEAWEIGACGGLEDAAEMKSYLDVEYAPAYKLDYECTPMLVGLESDQTIASVNANVKTFRQQPTDNGFTNADCLIYDAEYNTYYYNIISQTYEPDGRKVYDGLDAYGFSLSTLNSKDTVLAKTQYIRECRKARHRAEVGNYWLLRDSLYHACFLDLIGATDNEKKNTYPLKFGTLESGSRWRHRQDDLDTMADINNQGSADKKYSIVNTDSKDGVMIYKGNSSYHWRCIRDYYKDEMKAMMREIFDNMVALCPSGYGQSNIQKLVGCMRMYFWDYAQLYFTKGAYNIDARWTYEDAWRLYKSDKTVNAVHPLQQSLGSHYEAELAWMTMRMLFLASMNEWGAFVHYNDSSEGQVSFRQGGDFTFTLTPAIDMRPSVVIGSDSDKKFAADRIMAGDTATISVAASSDADTMAYIQGADWLQDVGDFSTLKLGSTSRSLAVTSKRLQTLKVGDENAGNVTTNIDGLEIGACPSLTEIEARNVSALSGEVDLSKCPRLRIARFGGTNATVIILPNGSKIEEFNLPSSLQRLTLKELPLLTKEGLTFSSLNAMTYLWVENNKSFDGYDILKTAYNAGSPLTNIRVIGFNKVGDDTDLTFLASLTNGDYHGINQDGSVNSTSLPNIEGVLTINGYAYEDDAEAVKNAYQNKVVIDALGYYIRFADPEVLRVLLAKGVGDGVGITIGEAESITDIGHWFRNNTIIQTFDELQRLKNVVSINGAFGSCTNLMSVGLDNLNEVGGESFNGCSSLKGDFNLPNLTKIGGSAFRDTSINSLIAPNVTTLSSAAFLNCKSLTTIGFDSIESIENNAFNGCESLTGDLVFPKLTSIGETVFPNTKINTFNAPNLQVIANGVFYNASLLESVSCPNAVEIGPNTFRNCKSLEYIDISNVTTIGANAFYGCSSLAMDIYLPKVTILDVSVFVNCSSLTHLPIDQFTEIGDSCFYNCTSLTGDYNLQVDEIASQVFMNTKITSIVALNAKSAGHSAFYGCSQLRYAEFGEIESFATQTFQSCINLETLIIRNDTPPTLGTNVFAAADKCIIYVPDSAVEAYKAAANWSSLASRIKPLSEYEG